jgi:hypothetical protein
MSIVVPNSLRRREDVRAAPRGLSASELSLSSPWGHDPKLTAANAAEMLTGALL